MGLIILFACSFFGPPIVLHPTDSSCRITICDRQISQYGSRWLVRYRMDYDGDSTLDVSSSDLSVAYDATVSNSRCKPHTISRLSQTQFALSETRSIRTTVIADTDEMQRCGERISVALSTGTQPLDDPAAAKNDFVAMRLVPGQAFWFYLSLEHDHFLYGPYDPLLGLRQLEIRVGPCLVTDFIPLDTEHRPQRPLGKLSIPPHERLNTRQFHSAPDSIHLTINEPGYQYFRFDDLPVRYNTDFTITFWYLIASGSDGLCHARVTEYQDAPGAWYRLGGGVEKQLTDQGHWVQFQQDFRTREGATTVVIDFRIVDASVGEMWIDDVQVVPRYADNRVVNQKLDPDDSPPSNRTASKSVAKRH